MKKFFVGTLMAGLLFIGTNAAAFTSWSWDLSAVGLEASIDGGAWTSSVDFNELMNISNAGNSVPDTLVTQSLGGDGILNNGDGFSEVGFLRQLGVDSQTVNFRDAVSNDSRRVYFYFDGLAGVVTNFVNGSGVDITLANFAADPTILGQISFSLEFTPNVGSIGLYVDDNIDFADGTLDTLATYNVLSGSGTSPLLNEGGVPNGLFSIAIGFDTVEPNFWSLPSGVAFEDFLALYGVNSIQHFADVNAANTSIAVDGGNFIFGVENSGTVRTQVVPEPSTILLLGAGLLGLGFLGRRKMLSK